MPRRDNSRLHSLPVSWSNSRRYTFESLEPRTMLAAFDVLVFSKTAGFRHDSIAVGVAAIQALDAEHDFAVVATENAADFTAANLANFEAVVFLNTTGDVLNAAQQAAFEQYIQAGGGWAGVHAAADAEYGWAWYGELVGAYFQSHPAIQQATLVVENHAHPSTAHLADTWVRTDEWYNFQTNPRDRATVLLTLDETTYVGGADGPDHPIAWYHQFDGGRAWYTGLGHTTASYSEPQFLQHLLGGIQYAAGQWSPAPPDADFNADGAVDGDDFLQWQRGYGLEVGAVRSDGDANADGKVDQADLGVWREQFGDAAAPPATPTTFTNPVGEEHRLNSFPRPDQPWSSPAWAGLTIDQSLLTPPLLTASLNLRQDGSAVWFSQPPTSTPARWTTNVSTLPTPQPTSVSAATFPRSVRTTAIDLTARDAAFAATIAHDDSVLSQQP